VDAAGGFDVVSRPGEVFPDRIIDPNLPGWDVAAADFRVEVVEAWAEEGKDVECPVQPASHLLPVL